MIFVSKSINNILPSIFENWFLFCAEIHNYNTVSSLTDKLFKPLYRSDSYSKNSVIISAISCWNEPQNMLEGHSLNLFIQPKLKTFSQKDASTNTNNLSKYQKKIVLEQVYLFIITVLFPFQRKNKLILYHFFEI